MSRPTYANVVATLALVVALGGTSYAATQLPRGSVGSTQLRANAVTTAKVRNDAVSPAKLSPAARALAASGPVTPGVVLGTVDAVPAANVGIENFRRASAVGVSNAVLFSSQNAVVAPVAMTVRGLRVRVVDDLPDGARLVFELVTQPGLLDESTPGVLSCTVTGTQAGDETACASSGSGVVPAGAAFFVRISVRSGTSVSFDPGSISFGYVAQPR